MTERTYENLKAMCEQGFTLQKMADEMHCSRQYVHQILTKLPELKLLRAEKAGEHLTGKQRKAVELQLKNDRNFGGLTRAEFMEDALRVEQRLKLLMKKHNAKNAKQEFALSWPDLEWPTHCPVLGIELDYYSSAGRRSENSASFDKINPELGYVKGNVRVISWRANRIKNDGTAAEHRAIADYIDSNS